MYLVDLIDTKKGDIISVVGSGGKTTFIYNIAKELIKEKVLISTTTKMLCPTKDEADYFFCLSKGEKINIKNGRTFIAGEKIDDNKVCGDIFKVENYISSFDYVLLESDGSKRKPLKGWNDTEPVIFNRTTKTIGIIPLHIIGEKITYENVHRIEKFNHIFKTNVGDEITLDVMADIIINPNGLFKDSIGEKILFLNRVEDEKSKEMAWKLLEILNRKNKNSLKIIGGSLKRKEYFMLSTGGDLK
ncbi:selenium cofactor biosynthesis protein YqeC [Clostridium sardiniense]|uniref:selenium cofactor biosynthesis protein YqeC n=1 Tax=Clostridium sardiniense TaxID=29369 RepID=UPI003D34688C